MTTMWDPTPSSISPPPPPNLYITTTDPATYLASFHSSASAPLKAANPVNSVSDELFSAAPTPNLSDNADLKAHLVSLAEAQEGPKSMFPTSGTSVRMFEIAPGMASAVEPYMHRTQTLDYAVVVQGEIELILDGGETRICRQGDVVVQRATRHAWRNNSETEWARLFFVIVATEKVFVGGKELGEDLGARKDADKV